MKLIINRKPLCWKEATSLVWIWNHWLKVFIRCP